MSRGYFLALRWLYLRVVLIIFAGALPAFALADSSPVLSLEAGGHSAPIRGLDVSRDGRFAITVSDDRSARIWDLTTGEIRHVIRPATTTGLVGKLYGVAVHPSEDLVAVGGTTNVTSDKHRILLFRMSTGEFVDSFDARGGDVTRLRWTHDGRVLLAVFRHDAAFRAFSRDGSLLYEERFKQASYGLDVSAQGHIAATSYDDLVHFYRYEAGRVTAGNKLRTQTPSPRGVAYSPDGRSLAVGYRGAAGNQGAPSIHDGATGALKFQFDRPDLAAGNLATIVWSGDGASLYAAGSAYKQAGVHKGYQFDIATKRVRAQAQIAGNTVTALVPAPSGNLAYASYDGSWGVATAQLKVTPYTSAISDFRGPSNLRISADATRVGVFVRRGSEPLWFDLKTRLIKRGDHPEDLQEPRLKAGLFSGAEWENTLRPEVNGQPIDIASDELSRSIAFFHNSKNAVLGTAKRLLAIDPDGRVRWSVQTPAEVWSVNVSADDQLAVTALADGTVRWWRTEDGSPLMSLLMLADGRWILWSPSGFYDASAGADRLAGWSVNRPDQPVADFFSLNRFRDRFNKPAVLDELLSLRDEESAMAVLKPAAPALASPTPAPTTAASSDVDLRSEQAAQAPVAVVQPVLTAAEKLELRQLFLPPVLSAEGPAVANTAAGASGWTIPFTVRAQAQASVEVRIDGRPAPDAQVEIRETVGSVTRGIATVRMAEPGSTVQLIAKDQYGVSEPLGVRIAKVVQALNAPASTTGVSAVASTESIPVPAVPAPLAPVAAQSGVVQPVALAAPPAPAPVPATPVATTGRRLVVLAIGISEYQLAEYQLGLAAKDASDFARTLAAQGGGLYSSVETRVLVNGEATGENIRGGFKWLEQSVGPNDLGVLFMAGHGLNTQQGEYFFLPWEADHRRLTQTGVPESLIRQSLSRLRGKALMFVDTCYAGGALGTFNTASRDLASLANDLASSENGVVVFASSTGRQLSEENDKWGNGAFTRAAIDGLTGKADFRNTGRVTFKSLDFYISERVSALTDGRQTPVTISPIGVPDFALARVI
ncbi:MAG: caspase family protein [Burkholderiaceae bacterium]